MKIFLCTLNFLLFSVYALGQEWDEVSQTELNLQPESGIENIPALILFDKCDIVVESDLEVLYTRFKRIKIFSEAGKKYAAIEIPLREGEKLEEIEAHSFRTSGEEVEYDPDEIYEKSINDQKFLILELPGIETGSVVEYQYEIRKPSVNYMEPWYFQDELPVRLSELTLSLRGGFIFEVQKENIDEEKLEYEKDDSDAYTTYIWRIRDTTPVIPEPFMYNYADYRSKLYFRLTGFQNAYMRISFLRDWGDYSMFIGTLYEFIFKADSALKPITEDLCRDLERDGDKARKLYYFVNDSIETIVESYNVRKDSSKALEVLKDRSGNVHQKNLLLLHLMKYAGLDAAPVFISTRSNGKFHTNNVDFNQFDHSLVMLNLNGRLTYLDCSNRYCPFGMLDEDLQVEKGLVIQEKKAALLTFRPVITDSRRQIKTVGEINENGDLYLQTEIKLCGYPAIGMREAFDRDSSEAIDQLLKDMHQEEVEIGHIDIQDLEELENPVTINIRYKLPRYAMKNLSIMYVPPPMITALRQNPFIPEKRIFNIDFPYSLEETENITLSFPAGFVLNEKPESVRIEQNDVYFNAYCFAKDNAVDFCRVFRRKRNHYTPEEYTFLKESYDKMVSSDQAQLVLSQDAH